MSGILGMIHLDGRPLDVDRFQRMMDQMSYRGPDGGSIWIQGSAALGHQMLRTTPESLTEIQPVVRDRYALVADARLDNRAELLAALHLSQSSPDLSDSELLLRCYERWGTTCPTRLVGDFAFAIWDAVERTLFCARDPFGTRPLYWARHNATIVFGSDINAVLQSGCVTARIDDDWVAGWLTHTFDCPGHTAYADISSLPAAHALLISTQSAHSARYWSAEDFEHSPGRCLADWAEGLKFHFRLAVHRRMRSALPLSASLSGGIDSSSIACMARDILGGAQTLPVFSVYVGDDPSLDERQYRTAVTNLGGFDSHEVDCQAMDPFSDLEETIRVRGLPIYVPSSNFQNALYNAARSEGIRCYLEGYGGDDVLSHGFPHIAELYLSGHWLRAWRESQALKKRSGMDRRLYPLYLLWDRTPSSIQTLYRLARRRPHHDNMTSLLSHSFVLRTNLLQRLQRQPPPPLRSTLAYDRAAITHPYNAVVVEMVEAALSARGMEARFPFFDRTLVEFCLTMPGEMKLRHGLTRFAHRVAMQGILPEQVQWRGTKSPIGLAAIQRLSVVHEHMFQPLLDGVMAANDYVNVSRARGLCRRYQRSPTPEDMFELFPILTLAYWLANRYTPFD